jgi:hypothetical protein
MIHDLFRFDAAEDLAGWRAIDDRVMGGVSLSRLRHDAAGHAVFEGELSLQRNGGFASVRSPARALGLPRATACVLEARGDGKRFKLALFMDDGFDSLSHQAEFTPDTRDWQAVRLPIEAFRCTRRGREVPGAPALEPARIRQVGLMIAGGQAGPFALAVRSIGLG